MSICVLVKTQKELASSLLFDRLAEKGEELLVVSSEFPVVRFGTYQKAIRGIEVTQEEGGYNVRVCVCSSHADYQLFAETVSALADLTGGKAFHEEDYRHSIKNPSEKFNEEWIEKNKKRDFIIMTHMIEHSESPFVIYGLTCSICLGRKLCKTLGIDLKHLRAAEDMNTLLEYMREMQWRMAGLQDTSSRYVLASSDETVQPLSLSMISITGGKVDSFDYVSEADLLYIVEEESGKERFIPFREVWKVLPTEVFRPIDDLQFERTGEVNAEMVRRMIDTSGYLQPDDPHYRPTYPGKGYDARQHTFILWWNPVLSDTPLEEYNSQVSDMLVEYFNWNIKDYNQARCGDRFFLLRTGEGRTGIVMSGVFDSHPYQIVTPKGKESGAFYIDMHPNVMLNPEKAPMVTTEQLRSTIPTFEWCEQAPRYMLNENEAQEMERLWSDFVTENAGQTDETILNMIE